MANESINQKQGVINKCPSCGGPLKAFVSVCELCGHELAGVGANKTITELVLRFNEIEDEVSKSGVKGSTLEKEVVARKARIIRDFPIPNSREDLQSLIYFIHPKIQDSIKPDPNAEDWRVKFREVLNLAKNAYKGDAKTRAQFEDIERSLNTTLAGSIQTRVKRSPIWAIVVGTVVVVAIAGVIDSQMDKWKLKRCESEYAEGSVTEKNRLEGILRTSDSLHKEQKFSEALSALSQLKWEIQTECKKLESDLARAQWEEKRKETVELVQKSDSAASAQRKAEIDRVDAEKRAEEERKAAIKIAAEAKIAAAKVTAEAKQAISTRKAATDKAW